MRGHNLGGGRRSRRAHVGNKVSDGEISFVTHGRDHGNCRSSNRARDHLFIKSPKVFYGSAAATDDDDVDPAVQTGARMKVVEKLDRPRDLLGRTITLH